MPCRWPTARPAARTGRGAPCRAGPRAHGAHDRCVLGLFPGCPPEEARAIAAHTARRGSGRVGRTLAGRKLEERALTAAVITAIRHRHTRYDELLMSGYSRTDARDSIHGADDRVLEVWRCPARSG
jgi:hypothetical protein